MNDKPKDQPERPEPAAPPPDAESQDTGTDPFGVPEGPGKKPPPPSNP